MYTDIAYAYRVQFFQSWNYFSDEHERETLHVLQTEPSTMYFAL